MEKAARAAGHASQQTTIFLKNIGSAAVFAVGPLSGLGARLIAFEAIAARVGVGMAATAAVLAAMSLSAVGVSVRGVKMQQTLLKMETALKAVRGSAAAARIDLEFVRDTTFDLGISFETGADQFTKLAAAASASGIPMRDVRVLFEGMSATAATLGLTTEETGRAFKAFEQIISKGVVSSEEIKQQLGDVLPGALGISASAMNFEDVGGGRTAF
jgi:tape measure domain-containing protein